MNIELINTISAFFPNTEIGYEINEKRQNIVNSWPADVDDSKAKEDWNWNPKHDFENAMEEYLIPGVKEFYKN